MLVFVDMYIREILFLEIKFTDSMVLDIWSEEKSFVK